VPDYILLCCHCALVKRFKIEHTSLKKGSLNPLQPKVFGVKFSLREIQMIFPIKLRNFKQWKMPKLLNFRFPEGGIY